MKFFIYARKSTDDEERQILSIQAQLDELRELARKESLAVAREYVEAQTAKEPGRLVFNDMMQALEKGEAQAILSWHPDRLARIPSGAVGFTIGLQDLSKLYGMICSVCRIYIQQHRGRRSGRIRTASIGGSCRGNRSVFNVDATISA